MQNLNIYKKITHDKLFSYKAKMAIILLDKKTVYEVLKEDAKKIMIEEGQPSAILQRAYKELYETKSWYIPDELKIWDRRFGELFKSPFFVYDDDEDGWSKILKYYMKYVKPQEADCESARIYNKEWEFYAEILAVAKQNNHFLFNETYRIFIEQGLPEKVFLKKQHELENIFSPDSCYKFGFRFM